MPDLEERFRLLARTSAPDLWPDAVSREPRAMPIGPSPGRRLAIAALAFVVAVAGVGLAVWAFRRGPEHRRTPVGPAIMNGRIAYASNANLWTIEPDGTDGQRLTSDLPGSAFQPSWSPDGTRLVFSIESHQDSQRASIDSFDLYEIGADGSGLTRLTTDGLDFQPSWSPDGTKIAYSHGTGPQVGTQDIWVMNADGSDPVALTHERSQALALSPSWSPDGRKILFVSNRTGTPQIYVMNADGTDQTQLTEDRVFHANPQYSPEGTQIAFAGSDIDGPGIYVMNADGTGTQQLTHDAQDGPLTLSWAPDATKIVYTTSPQANQNIVMYVLDPATKALTQIGPKAGQVAGLAWQPVPIQGGSPSPSASPSMPPPATPAVSDVALPDGLGATRVAVGEGSVWALASTGKAGSSVLVRIDPATDQVLAMTPLEAEPWYVAAGGGAVWVGSARSSTIERVDSATNEVTGQIQLTGDGVSAIAADEQAVWVEVIQDHSDQGQQNLASLVRIDQQTSEVVATIPLEGLSGYDDEIAIGAGAVWVAGVNLTGPSEERGADLVRIDPTTNTISAELPVSAFSVRAGADAVWVTSPADGVNDSVHKPESWVAREIDPMTNEISAPLPLPGNVSGVLAVTADAVWFTGYDDQGLIHPVRLQAGAFDASVPPINSVYTDVAFDDASGTIWVATISGLKRIDTR